MCLQVDVNEDGTVDQSTCGCARRHHLCHHVAAVLLDSLNHVSKTDKPCQWNKPAPPKNDTKPCSFYYPPSNFKAIDRPPTNEDREYFLQRLSGLTCGFTWLLAPEPPTPVMAALTVDDILSHPDFVQSDNQLGYFLQHMSVSTQQICKVERDTVGQRDNILWGIYRKGRLTSSNFGKIIKTIDSNRKPSASLLKSLSGTYNLSGIKAVQWGIQHEQDALKAYETNFSVTVEPAGLFLDRSGLIGTSPDGLVGNDIVVEVKCPWSQRETTTFEEALAQKNFFMKATDGALEFTGDQGSAYNHQIQAQLALTGRSKCHFIIWTPNYFVRLEIMKDPSWEQYLPKLKDFYVNYFFKHLAGQE